MAIYLNTFSAFCCAIWNDGVCLVIVLCWCLGWLAAEESPCNSIQEETGSLGTVYGCREWTYKTRRPLRLVVQSMSCSVVCVSLSVSRGYLSASTQLCDRLFICIVNIFGRTLFIGRGIIYKTRARGKIKYKWSIKSNKIVITYWFQ